MEPFIVQCPYCGEQVDLVVEEDVAGELVQDCEVCCRPWRVVILRRRGAAAEVFVDRAQ